MRDWGNVEKGGGPQMSDGGNVYTYSLAIFLEKRQGKNTLTKGCNYIFFGYK